MMMKMIMRKREAMMLRNWSSLKTLIIHSQDQQTKKLCHSTTQAAQWKEKCQVLKLKVRNHLFIDKSLFSPTILKVAWFTPPRTLLAVLRLWTSAGSLLGSSREMRPQNQIPASLRTMMMPRMRVTRRRIMWWQIQNMWQTLPSTRRQTMTERQGEEFLKIWKYV